MHALNIIDIQKETLRLLTNSQKALSDILASSYVVDGNNVDQKQTLEKGFITEQQRILFNEAQKAKNLEMVIAVVGTMKAGKSTSINAIVGQEVLPNRALPMTALPTVVTHTPGQTEPVLYFKHTEPLTELSLELLKELSSIETGSASKEIMYPFLGSEAGRLLSEKLRQNDGFHFDESYTGQDAIFKFLQELNDLMRMAKELNIDPPYSEYQAIDDLPRIEVEFYHLKHNASSSHGRLSILDTPGPNEFGQSDALKKVFSIQLKQASAVLLVMDYTQLNSESDGKLRQEIDSIKKDLGERLYVLVNKFDNANKNTMNTEATRNYVATNLLGNLPEEKVFPVSSWLGYLANRGLHELELNGKIDESQKWVKDFGEKVLGPFWEEDISDISRVEKSAKRIWEKSNFQAPLDSVINEAYSKAAFESLGSTLEKMGNLVGELGKGVEGRISGLDTDINTLQDIVIGLQEDTKTLDTLEDKFVKSINKEIELVDIEVKEKTLSSIKDTIDRVERSLSSERSLALAKSESEAKDYGSTGVNIVGRIFDIFDHHTKSKYDKEDVKKRSLSELIHGDEIVFDSRGAAVVFLNKIESLLKEEIKNIDNVSNEIADKRLKSLQNDVDLLMKKDINEVVEKAQEKLGDKGVDVSFRLPSFQLKENTSISHDGFLSQIEDKTTTKTGSRKKDGYIAGFFNFFNDDWGREDYKYVDKKFEVGISSVRDQSKKMLENHADKIKKSQSDFFAKELNGQVKIYINGIKEYLERYRGDLIQGLADQKNSSEKKVQQKGELSSLSPQLASFLEDIGDQTGLLKNLEATSEASNEKLAQA